MSWWEEQLGINPRSRVGQTLAGIPSPGDLATTAGTGLEYLYDEYGPMAVARKGMGEIGDLLYEDAPSTLNPAAVRQELQRKRQPQIPNPNQGNVTYLGERPQTPSIDEDVNREMREGALRNYGGHVRATIGGKEYDYTSPATNELVQGNLGASGRAPQQAGGYLFDPAFSSGPTPELAPTDLPNQVPGEEWESYKARINAAQMAGRSTPGTGPRVPQRVSDPGVSFIQGRPEQQQALQYEDLQRQNAIAQEKQQLEFNQLSPGDKARIIAQQKAAADPRFAMMSQLQSIIQNIVIPAVQQEEAAYRQAHPNATPQEISMVRRQAASTVFNAASKASQSIFGRTDPYGLEFPEFGPGEQQ